MDDHRSIREGGDAGNERGASKPVARGAELTRVDPSDARIGIAAESREPGPGTGDNEQITGGETTRGKPEAQADVEHGDERSPVVNDPFDYAGGARQGCDCDAANDFPDHGEGERVPLKIEAEKQDLERPNFVWLRRQLLESLHCLTFGDGCEASRSARICFSF